MFTEEQLRYVKDQLSAGVAETTIRDTLAQSGYDDESISELLQRAQAEMAGPPPVDQNGEVAATTEAGSAALPPVGEFFSGSWSFVMQRIDVLGYLAVILLLFGWLPWIGPVVSVLVAAIALFVALRPKTTFADALGWMQDNFVSYLWVVILVSLVTLTGFVLLIIPAIILGSYLILAPSLRVEQGVKGLHALVKSTQMIYGVWWGTFGRLLLLGLSTGIVVAIIVAILGSIIGYSEEAAAEAFFYWQEVLLMAPGAIGTMVMAAGAARIYQARKNVVIDEADVPASGTLRTLYLVFAWLGIPAFIIAVSFFLIVLTAGAIFGAM